jgi:hypothetical protein
MLTVLRWIAFLPAGFAAAVVAGALFGFVGARFGEFIGFTTSGAISAAAFIYVGLMVAPKRNNIVKWVLIVPSVLFGILSAIGDAYGADKLRMSIGISMALSSLAFAAMPTEEIVRNDNS